MKKVRTRNLPGSHFQHGSRLSGVDHQSQRKVRSWRVVRIWGYSPYVWQSRGQELCVSHSARMGVVIEGIIGSSTGLVIGSTVQTASRETTSIVSTTLRVSATLTYPYRFWSQSRAISHHQSCPRVIYWLLRNHMFFIRVSLHE
jgi:hypothetical protein